MIDVLFGGRAAERVLLFLNRYGQGYAMEIARRFELPVSEARKQLLRFEAAGALVSFEVGRTRIFRWNPRYPFLKELKALLDKAMVFVPGSEMKRYFSGRQRPRRTGKPL